MLGKELAEAVDRMVAVWPQLASPARRREEYRRSLARLTERLALDAVQVSAGIDLAVDEWTGTLPPGPGDIAEFVRRAAGVTGGTRNGRVVGEPRFEPAGPNTWRVVQPGRRAG